MSKLNRTPRKFNIKHEMVTIIHPDVTAKHIRDNGLYLSDFIDVPRISTHGEWPMSHMIPDEQLLHLAVMANALSGKPANGPFGTPKRRTYSDRWNEKHNAQVASKSKGARNGA